MKEEKNNRENFAVEWFNGQKGFNRIKCWPVIILEQSLINQLAFLLCESSSCTDLLICHHSSEISGDRIKQSVRMN